MPRGISVSADLRHLLYNAKYSDISVVCSDGELPAIRSILAARSEVLDNQLYSTSTPASTVSFPNIKISAMKAILEFLYTGAIGDNVLTIDNAVETYHAADCFQLTPLKDDIVLYVRETLKDSHIDLAARLLSEAAEKMQSKFDNPLFKLLAKRVAATPLHSIRYDRLNSEALQVLLSQTLDKKDEFFATPEYGVVRYVVLWSANKVSPKALKFYDTQLPTTESIESSIPKEALTESALCDPGYTESKDEMTKLVTPIAKNIDLSLLHPDVIANIIEPLDIFPARKLLEAYRFHSTNKTFSNDRRGLPPFRWDRSFCGNGLVFSESDTVVSAPPAVTLHQSVRAVNCFSSPRVYEWDVIIEETCGWAWVGVADPNETQLDYQIFLGGQNGSWMLGSNGASYHHKVSKQHVVPAFESDGTTVTVHLDMRRKTMAFSIDGTRHPDAFTDLPDKVHPAVSLVSKGRFKILPHM
ncbi:9420_t:CDS:1 [Paraglomus occultum]|uniref:9420_t:CDS:1 n=1 Tax=Paraglomus occultum TaxID=144539 RepID=A0A9N9C2N5_9GLOM|nr:9420_t:CDS:1 [Paraglomus occultum]